MWSVKDFTYARTFINANIVSEKIQCFLTIMFLLIYPLMVLQFKHHGIWVCINLNHAAHYFSGYFYLSSCSPILYMYWLSTVHIVCLCKHSIKLHMYTVQAYKMIAISATSAIWVFRYIVKFVQIKTHFQLQCNIGKIMLIKIIVIIHILSS